MSVNKEISGVSRHSLAEKLEAVRLRIFQERSFSGVLSDYGISHGTLCRWITLFKDEVLRRESSKGLPLYVRKYQTRMTSEETHELERLRRENADLKLINEANELLIRLAKERLNIDVKKTTRRCYPNNQQLRLRPKRLHNSNLM